MRRVYGWAAGVLLLVLGWCGLTVAPWLAPWLGLALPVLVCAALAVSLLRARRLGVRLIDVQRQDGHALQRTQDPFLGRLPAPELGAGADGRPATSLVDPQAIDRDPGRLDP